MRRLLATMLLGLLPLLGGQARAGQVFDNIKARNSITCGVNPGLHGFARRGPDGVWRGLEVDFCHALAAAVIGDPARVRFVPLTAAQRFTALQHGEVDVLVRNTSFNMTRDVDMGLRAVVPLFFDGHSFLVRTDSGITSSRGLDGQSICLIPGTTNEETTREVLRGNGVFFTVVPVSGLEEAVAAIGADRCQVAGADASQLAVLRNTLPNPESFKILPQRYSKEVLGPLVRRGDEKWFQVVRWTAMALIEAEELGVTRANAESMLRDSKLPSIRRLLGAQDQMGKDLGLSPDWAYRMLRSVGNYGEIFDRNLGAGSFLKLERGLNGQWSKGGLMYAWPLR
jgi:general L-amino acid transport system substrate-binding protein